MSSTRYAQDGSPLNQSRYMSAPEFDELRAINPVATAARVALLEDQSDRELLWWLQAQSLQPRGLKNIVAGLLKTYPDQVGTSLMFGAHRNQTEFEGRHLLKILTQISPFEAQRQDLQRSARISARLRRLQEGKLDDGQPDEGREPDVQPQNRAQLQELCRERALKELEEDLIQLCINPAINLQRASVPYFRDIVGALRDFKSASEEALRKSFVLTEVARQVWATLDHGLERSGMVLVEGLEGRGKTEAAKTWAALHCGVARFVSLKGISGKTNVFRAIAKAIGIASNYGYKANQLQSRVEDILKRSGLMLVADEAHWLFDPRPRMLARPELMDWINTAVCNEGLPIALITTPQFLQSAQQAGEQVNWNWRQFKRRVKQYVILPPVNTEADLTAVAKRLLPGVNATGIKMAVSYAKLRKLDISGLGDVVEEAQLLARKAGRASVTSDDVNRAIREYLMPTDAAFAQRLTEPRSSKPRSLEMESEANESADRSAGELEIPKAPFSRRAESVSVSREQSPEVAIHG